MAEWNFSPSYLTYESLSRNLKAVRETRVWFAWDKLVLAFQMLDDVHSKIANDLFERNKHWDLINWHGLVGEMRKVLDEKFTSNDKPYEFIASDYRYYLDKVHKMTVAVIEAGEYKISAGEAMVKPGQPTNIETKWSIKKDENNVVVTINGRHLDWMRDSDGGKLLAELDDSENGSIANDEFYEILSDDHNNEADMKKKRRKAYDVARFVNTRISKEYNVGRFLLFNMTQVSFNPIYSRIFEVDQPSAQL